MDGIGANAVSALGAIFSGIVLFIVNASHAAQREWRAGIEKRFSELHEKDEKLGREIQDTRGALGWICGKQGLDRPTYD